MVDIMTSKGLVRKIKKLKNDDAFYPTNTSQEAKICLNCPFPDCKQGWKGCKYFLKERKKLKVLRNEKRNKKVNKKSVL